MQLIFFNVSVGVRGIQEELQGSIQLKINKILKIEICEKIEI